MVFSWSAPLFTNVEEQEEREGLKEDELLRIREDLYGIKLSTDSRLDYGHGMSESEAIQALHSCLERGIPDTEKAAYQEAIRKCPDIVKAETNPLLFLWAEDFNIEVSIGAGQLVFLQFLKSFTYSF